MKHSAFPVYRSHFSLKVLSGIIFILQLRCNIWSVTEPGVCSSHWPLQKAHSHSILRRHIVTAIAALRWKTALLLQASKQKNKTAQTVPTPYSIGKQHRFVLLIALNAVLWILPTLTKMAKWSMCVMWTWMLVFRHLFHPLKGRNIWRQCWGWMIWRMAL